MSSDSDPIDDKQQNGHHVIFVDGAGKANQQTYQTDTVDAVTIIKNAGYDEDPEGYILEALRGQSGTVEKQFDPQGEGGPSDVNLSAQHRQHFRVTTRGQPFI